MARKAKKTTWAAFDAADYLRTEADIAAYLDAALEESVEEPRVLAHALGDIARARRRMSGVARNVGVTREGLYKGLSRNGNPSFVMVARAARALGFEIHLRRTRRNAA